MNAYFLLLAEFIVSSAVSLAALHVLSRPLIDVLERICPDEQAAAFWQTYTKVMLVIAPLLLVLTIGLFSNISNPLDSLRLTLIAALAGLVAGLYSVGKRLVKFVVVPDKTRSES